MTIPFPNKLDGDMVSSWYLQKQDATSPCPRSSVWHKIRNWGRILTTYCATDNWPQQLVINPQRGGMTSIFLQFILLNFCMKISEPLGKATISWNNNFKYQFLKFRMTTMYYSRCLTTSQVQVMWHINLWTWSHRNPKNAPLPTTKRAGRASGLSLYASGFERPLCSMNSVFAPFTKFKMSLNPTLKKLSTQKQCISKG